MIYLDHNATTPVRPEVRQAMAPYLERDCGNPSSLHEAGRLARAAIDEARSQVASLLGCATEALYFTSGGTEADNWAVLGVARRRSGRIITTSVEHAAVLDAAESLREDGRDVVLAPVSGAGRVDPEALLTVVDGGDTALVSLILANNETGTLQPVAEIGAALRDRGIPFHVDAVQACGRIPVDVEALRVDLLSVSAHKMNGPKGVGALYVRPGTPLAPWLRGGGHEHGLRAGTENVPGIVGFGAAAALRARHLQADATRWAGLRNDLEARLLDAVPDTIVNGDREQRLPNTLNVSFRAVEAEAVLLGLDLEGIAAASGSACTSGSTAPSHVLLAMGLEPRLASSAVRFSLGWGNDEGDVDRVLAVLPPIVGRLRALSVF